MDTVSISLILAQYMCLLFSLCIHEAAHAAMADRCGDPTARLLGRVTLNPVPHIDWIGTVLLPLLGMMFHVPFLFGWAKPVPFNPSNLRKRRRDSMLIALAGPGANLLVALTVVVALRVMALLIPDLNDSGIRMAFHVVEGLMFINLLLLVFNLIPLPPLDGYGLLEFFLPYDMQKKMEQIGAYSTLILFFLVFSLNILKYPLAILSVVFYILAYYGTPMWGILASGN